MTTQMTNFKQQLEKIKNTAPTSQPNTYLLKGDISGIQDFIFNTKSKGASKTLKAKSFYVQALAEMAIKLIEYVFGGQSNITKLYNGGGNFYLFVPKNDDKLNEIQKQISEGLCKDDVYIILSWTENLSNFQDAKRNLEVLANERKYQKFQGLSFAFEPFHNNYRTEKESWKEFARNLLEYKGFELEVKQDVEGIFSKYFQKFGVKYTLSKNKNQFEKSVLTALPTWTEENTHKYGAKLTLQTDENGKPQPPEKHDIIEFSHLADIAKYRTGTDKLGVLKMDVDNLGVLFGSQQDIANTYTLSASLKWFFEQYMLDLLEQEFEGEKFKENIYVVFSGGDDCFMLGAYDAILEFALSISEKFNEFQTALRETLPTITDKVTLSASVILVNGSFPVTRFAELAEDALKKAKTFEKDEISGNYIKGKINVFGEVLSWSEFKKSKEITTKLVDLINAGEPRGILERIRNSAIGYEKLQASALKGKLAMPKVWRLKYYLRNVKKENYERMSKIFNDYSVALLKAASKKETCNPALFQVAARWAEFLTKSKEKK